MSILELVFIAFGLSMDAFAVSVCKGLSLKKTAIKHMLIVGLYFGIFQGLMPLIGFAIGSQFSDMIIKFDHWIAFGLLAVIGTKMIVECFKKDGCKDRVCPTDAVCTDRACPINEASDKKMSLKPNVMLPLALATSIDALAVGVSFAFLKIDILLAVLLIGGITLTLSALGVKIGSIFGTKLKSKAEFVGGVVLILMGTKILFEHLGVF